LTYSIFPAIINFRSLINPKRKFIMDITFLIKQFLPPGVTIEALTEECKVAMAKILAAAQLIERSHALLLEQNAMLRQIIAQSQAQAPTIDPGTPNVDQTHIEQVQVPEPSPGRSDADSGSFPIGTRTNTFPASDAFGTRDPASGNCGSDGGNSAD
jgi:hypothetical protein